MNEQPSPYNLAFSYLLIPVIAGILVAGTGSDRIDTHIPPGAEKNTIADSIAIINAEASLPVYAAREARGNANELVAERARDITTMESPAAGQAAATLSADHDTWHIHIASLTNRNEADRIVQRARENGIAATQTVVVVNGTRFWRVSVKDPHSYGEAKRHADRIRDQLGLKDVWLSRESGQ